MLYSTGDCPVCGPAGDILFVKDRVSNRLFFMCPSCGCAWANPPPPYVLDTIDPPQSFAPSGVVLPEKFEIVTKGLEAAIEREINDNEWMDSLSDFLDLTP